MLPWRKSKDFTNEADRISRAGVILGSLQRLIRPVPANEMSLLDRFQSAWKICYKPGNGKCVIEGEKSDVPNCSVLKHSVGEMSRLA